VTFYLTLIAPVEMPVYLLTYLHSECGQATVNTASQHKSVVMLVITARDHSECGQAAVNTARQHEAVVTTVITVSVDRQL